MALTEQLPWTQQVGTQWGQSPDFFGYEDYARNRRRGIGDEQILEYLQANPGKLRGHNVIDDPTGIYEHIRGRGQISKNWGDSADWFGHADAAQALKMGHTPLAIMEYMRANDASIRRRNKPGQYRHDTGQPGLYEQLSRGDLGELTTSSWDKFPTATVGRESPPSSQYIEGSDSVGTTASGVRRKYSPEALSGASSRGTTQLNRMFINQAHNI